MTTNETTLSRIIGKNIELLIKEHNINQTDLAVVLGVSESAVGKWILGKAIPRMGTVQKIADYFHVPKSTILEDSKSASSNLDESHSRDSDVHTLILREDEISYITSRRELSDTDRQFIDRLLETYRDHKSPDAGEH